MLICHEQLPQALVANLKLRIYYNYLHGYASAASASPSYLHSLVSSVLSRAMFSLRISDYVWPYHSVGQTLSRSLKQLLSAVLGAASTVTSKYLNQFICKLTFISLSAEVVLKAEECFIARRVNLFRFGSASQPVNVCLRHVSTVIVLVNCPW